MLAALPTSHLKKEIVAILNCVVCVFLVHLHCEIPVRCGARFYKLKPLKKIWLNVLDPLDGASVFILMATLLNQTRHKSVLAMVQ